MPPPVTASLALPATGTLRSFLDQWVGSRRAGAGDTPRSHDAGAMGRVALVGAGYVATHHLAALKQLDFVDVVGICDPQLPAAQAGSVDFIHRFAEAGRLAYADRAACVGDPMAAPVPVEAMLDERYLARRAAALFSPKFWLCGASTGSLRSLYPIFTSMSPAGPSRYPAFPIV